MKHNLLKDNYLNGKTVSVIPGSKNVHSTSKLILNSRWGVRVFSQTNERKQASATIILLPCAGKTSKKIIGRIGSTILETEVECTFPKQNADSSMDKISGKTLENSISHNCKRYQNWASLETCKETAYQLLFSSQSFEMSTKGLKKDPILNQKHNQTHHTSLANNYVKPVEIQAPPSQSI